MIQRVYWRGYTRLGMAMLSFWFSPFGRAARADYWYWLMAPAAAATIVLSIIGPLMLGHIVAKGLLIGGAAIFCISHTALAIRRLHDQSVSGWYALALVVPLGGAGIALVAPGALDFEALNSADDHVKLALLGLFAAVFAPFAIVLDMIWFRIGKDGGNRYGRDPLYR